MPGIREVSWIVGRKGKGGHTSLAHVGQMVAERAPITLASKMIKNHVAAAYWTHGWRK